MSVRMRHTRAHTRNRRSHHGLKAANFVKCKKCNAPVMPHIMCTTCGTYRGREVVDVMAKLDKKEKKAKELEMEEQKQDKPLDAEGLSKK